MKKIAVFYHLSALNHLWKEFIDEQLGLLETSKLTESSIVKVCYNSSKEYSKEIENYIKTNYSFVEIISYRSEDEDNLYEGQTLKELQEYSKNNDGYILYFHSKGILHSINSHQTIPTRDWRHYMNYWMIERWKDCIRKIKEDDVDVVGTNWNSDPYWHFSGNFWWSTTEHIRNLPDVLNRSLYYDENLTEQLGGHTFSYEMWILSNKPKIRSMHCSGVNHYFSPYPRERYATLENTMLNYKNEKKVQKTINVFYHLFIPDTNNMWVWWVDEQMSLLKQVGLVDKAKINMCMTLPLGLYNSKTGHSYDEMVIGYIKDRYPFVNIIDIKSVGEQPNLYEGQTLAKIYEHCQEDDGYVFYFHNKGMVSYTTHISGAIKDWRHYMQYFNLEKWEDCVAKLDEGYDCCGVDWVERHDIKLDFVVQHYAGNFWWARNDYIRKLKHPLNIEEYMDVEAMMRELQNYRYCFELWMATGIPKQHCFHYRRHHQYDNQGLERYFTYYPPEMYRDDVERDETSYTRNRLDVLMEVGSKNLFNWRDHRQFADWLVRRKQPDTIVDLGVDYGYSTFCFAIPGIGNVYGIDSFEGDICAGERDTYEYVMDKVKELELTNVSIIKGFFDDVVKTWNKPIDILHIDGLHTYEAVKNDFEKWSPFVKENGIILMHDTMVDDPKFGVSRFFKEINLPKTNFEHCNGLGVVSKDINLIDEIKKNFGEFIREI